MSVTGLVCRAGSHPNPRRRLWYGAPSMVGITPPRKLQTAGLFAYTPTPTIDDAMKVLRGSDDLESNGITRREMLKHVGLVGTGDLLGTGLTLAAARPESGSAQGSERPWYELS